MSRQILFCWLYKRLTLVSRRNISGIYPPEHHKPRRGASSTLLRVLNRLSIININSIEVQPNCALMRQHSSLKFSLARRDDQKYNVNSSNILHTINFMSVKNIFTRNFTYTESPHGKLLCTYTVTIFHIFLFRNHMTTDCTRRQFLLSEPRSTFPGIIWRIWRGEYLSSVI